MPVELARFEAAEWASDEDVPAGRAGLDDPWLRRRVIAYKRWLAARRAWAQERGLDYGDTFRPEWRATR